MVSVRGRPETLSESLCGSTCLHPETDGFGDGIGHWSGEIRWRDSRVIGSGYPTRTVPAGGDDRKARLGITAGLTHHRCGIVSQTGRFDARLQGDADDVELAADTPHLSPSAA